MNRYSRLIAEAKTHIETGTPDLSMLNDLVSALEESENEVARITRILDQHLPTVIAGLQHVVHPTIHKDRDELTEDDVALRGAMSAAHWIAKDVATGGGKPLYDLPSVLDLLAMLKRERENKK